MSNHDVDREVDRDALRRARAVLATTLRDRRARTREAAESARTLERLSRVHGANDDRVRRAREEHAEQLRGLDQARAAAARAKRDLRARLDEWLAPRADDDLARLRTGVPIVLFPVRLETRFTPTERGVELKVRIYPDTILGRMHDPLLTNEERAAGEAYWGQAWADDEPRAWRQLLARAPGPRAAWIVRAMEPVNLEERPEGEPVFPAVETRAESWDRAPDAPILPDRWVVLAYRDGAEAHRAVSRPVEEPLALGFDPHAPPREGVDVSGDGLELDADLVWTVDFARAEEAGMALRMPLDAEDAQRGFDRLVVLGVKGSLAPETGGEALEQLLDGHHYAEGLALLAQGTPTNNKETTSTPFPRPDPDGAHSFAVERGDPLNTEDGDGVNLTRALGLTDELVAHVEGADRREQVSARAMGEALWPVTWGYFLEQMMAPHVDDAAIAEGRRHFVEHVRGRGPLPALRVGGQPYGILPVSSLDRWEPRADAVGADAALPPLLRRLRGVWRSQIDRIPRVGRTGDADADLLTVLGMDASAREVRVRRVDGPDFQLNLLAFLGIDATGWEAARDDIVRPIMDVIGFPDWDPRILGMTFADRAGRFRFPFVAPGPVSEDAGLEDVFGFDYIRWIREASIEELREERGPQGRAAPDTLLYRMLRHARLEELKRVGFGLQVAHGLATAADRLEPELVGIADATTERPTVWQRFERPIPGVTGDLALGEFLVGDRESSELTSLRDYDGALARLEGLPTAELERLFTETLDLCAHRLDAWITSLATKRLREMREAEPNGAYVGAFGWVEDLHPAAAAGDEETLRDGRTVRVSTTNAGYVHAPSMQHASAAAVLRNGHLTRSGEQGAPYAVDLSSSRVRTALSVLDAVREGQPFGGVLGYRFERALHERGLDRFIEPLRRRFPIVANKAGDPELEGPPDAVAARNVVDGLALRNAWRDETLDLEHDDFAHDGDPATAAERAAVATELERLDEATDAAADLLTAEAVYQIVGGNTAGANAGLDAVAKGGRPPDPEVARPPRTGIPLTHRVGIVLGEDAVEASGWEAAPTPRSLAEPFVDGWVGHLLGDPHTVVCRVRVRSPNEDSESEPTISEEPVTLADLELRPIDLLGLVRAVSEDGAVLSELDRRVADAALANAPAHAGVEEILYARADDGQPTNGTRSFPEILETARAIQRVLASARPLEPADLVPPEARPSLQENAAADEQTRARAEGAHDALIELAGEIADALAMADVDDLRRALQSAGRFGVSAAFPRDDTPADLEDRAGRVQSEIERRVAEATAASNPIAIAKAVFGREFPFLPRFSPPGAEELEQALGAAATVVEDPREPRRWLYQAARVRPALATWRSLALLSRALGTHGGTLDVVQLPHREGAAWVALPFQESSEPASGTLSLVLHRFATPAADRPWVGLLLDEWDELIPHRDLAGGVAFHFDTPGAEPPQAILIAVPPTNAESWSLDALVSTLLETLDLAKLRAVDSELLGSLAQLAPAVFLAANAADDTVSTDFGQALVADRPNLVAEG